MPRVAEIIAKKKAGRSLSAREIEIIINGYLDGSVTEGQMAAWLMAVCWQGLNKEETLSLTEAMLASGETVDLTSIDGPKVDKHSTGGVGDKLSLVVVPLVASAGVKVPKMSGRGLGHTGGTLDKLSSIPGFSTELTPARFIEVMNTVGAAIISQSAKLVPADKKIYALRDQTATVASIPLIASSIMSKKLAAGADAIVLDVKVGSGAFIKDITEARRLAELMVWLGKQMSRPTKAVLTNMEQPLGRAIGNALEVDEALKVLKGAGPGDLRRLSIAIGREMLTLSGLVDAVEAAEQVLESLLENGQAYNKFKEIVKAQNGDIAALDDWRVEPVNREAYKAKADGYLKFINTELLGYAALELGAGRRSVAGDIDYDAGLVMAKKAGEVVSKGDILIDLYIGHGADLKKATAYIDKAIEINLEPLPEEPLIYEVIG